MASISNTHNCPFIHNSSLDGFNFAHINPGSLVKNIDSVRDLLIGNNLHAFAVSETWFHDKVNSGLVAIPGFELIRQDRTIKRGGGVAIYLKSGIAFRLLHKSHHNANAEFLFIEIDNKAGVKFAFGAVYNPPGNSRLDPLLKCLTSLANEYDDCIFTGDFNINLLLSTPPVLRFKNFLHSINLSCPLSSPTNFVPNCQPSLIDLILT